MKVRLCPQCAREYHDGEVYCPFDGVRLRETARGNSTVPPTDPLLGTVVDGRYRVDRVLGRGGIGTVYAAVQTSIERPVALKVLRKIEGDDTSPLGRFEREAKAASKLGNPHIVSTWDFGYAESGQAFLVMELLEGEDLANILAREGRLHVERAAVLVAQICVGLAAAHRTGIVHRDLKPENLFVTKAAGHDCIKIVDFGLAKIKEMERPGGTERKLTKTGMVFGTPQYMSPEQCLGREADERSDIYSLGVIFFELLSGRPPFDGDAFMQIARKHVESPVPLLSDASPGLCSLIVRMLAKQKEARPQNVKQVALDLADALRTSEWVAAANTVRELAQSIETAVAPIELTRRKQVMRDITGPVSIPPPASPPLDLAQTDLDLGPPSMVSKQTQRDGLRELSETPAPPRIPPTRPAMDEELPAEFFSQLQNPATQLSSAPQRAATPKWLIATSILLVALAIWVWVR